MIACENIIISNIQNAGDCVARTGVREKGFKFGSLPHDPGGITCMVRKYLQFYAENFCLSKSVHTSVYYRYGKVDITSEGRSSGCLRE